MIASTSTTDAFESLAHALRILPEAYHGAHHLLAVDPHEAAGNLEQGLNQLLNSIASVYDASLGLPGFDLDWYGTPETAVVLAIRNARHHNHANRIRGLYDYHLQQDAPATPRRYLFVDYPETEDGGRPFAVPVSWHDFSTLLSLPRRMSRLSPDAVAGMRRYLDADRMDLHGAGHGVGPERVFLNVAPLIVNAVRKFVPLLKPHLAPRSSEARWFVSHFENVPPSDTHAHRISHLSVFLPA